MTTETMRDKMAEDYGGETPQFAFSDGWDACYNYLKETGQLGGNRAVDLLMELCQLKHYKDTVGKDAFYEQRQPELWKAANDYLNKITTPPTGQLKEDVATSSNDILKHIKPIDTDLFNEETLAKMQYEIEEKMKDWDLEKRIRTAKSIQELSKLIITL